MKQAIGVLAFDRPNHLYVALDSIFHMKGIEDWLVGVYFDGGLSREACIAAMESLKYFPVDKVVFFRRNLGIVEGTLTLMRDLFYKEECEEFLFMAEDLIIRTDTLEFLPDFIREDAFAYQLSHHTYQTPGALSWSTHFNQCGFVIFKEEFKALDSWIRSKLFLGQVFMDEEKTQPVYGAADKRDQCDHIIRGFMEAHNAPCKFPTISYVAHTGLVGLHSFNTPACVSLENDIFQRPRESWLEAFGKLWPYSPGKYAEAVEYMLIPNHFEYA